MKLISQNNRYNFLFINLAIKMGRTGMKAAATGGGMLVKAASKLTKLG